MSELPQIPFSRICGAPCVNERNQSILCMKAGTSGSYLRHEDTPSMQSCDVTSNTSLFFQEVANGLFQQDNSQLKASANMFRRIYKCILDHYSPLISHYLAVIGRHLLVLPPPCSEDELG
ncbi:hypothetical protein TNCV_3684321 [Trichonephila clavipes]|uniref:Uncharacterized protein n=1 Tax=Trichonephila clavipes TaxID=2585209 RepID=A0A8X6RJL6_TRICX|nr:hypothetical protein TNCV_3684321 [Trichonephila clavipes]